MALDFDALRKKLATLQGQNNRSTATWKPPEGKSTIRILPWKENPDNPFIELYFHYLGGKTQLSPLSKGLPDPIAEFGDSLRSSPAKTEEERRNNWQLSKQFSPKQRTYVAMIVRGEEDKGVRFWGFGKLVYKELAAVMVDPDWGDITDPQTGRDVTIEFTPKKPNSPDFAKTEVRVKPNASPLTTDADLMKKLLTVQPDINEIFVAPTYEELQRFLEKYVNADADTSVTATEKAPAVTTDDDDLPSEVVDVPVPAVVAEAVGPVPTTAAPVAAVKTEASSASKTKKSSAEEVADEFARLFSEK